MDTYIVQFDANKQGVYAISLVESPAIEVDFVALSKQEIVKLAAVDEEKRLLISPVLIPDMPILRVDENGNPYNIVFPAETIRQAQQNFYKQGFQNNSTLEHDENMKLSDVTFVESWIKEDMKLDKSVKYGFDQPVGTWFTIMKVDNDEVWGKVKAGEVKGLSIDGVFDFEQLKLNKDMNYENLKLWLSDTFGLTAKADEPEVKEVEGTEEAQVELAAEFFYDGELIEGLPIFSDAEMTMPLEDGEYTIDGKLIVIAEGKVLSIDAQKEEAPAQEVEVEVEMAEGDMPVDAPAIVVEDMAVKIAELETKIAAIEEMLSANNIAMSKMIAEGFEKLIQDGEEVEKPTQLTKAMPIVEAIAEPKNAAERILNKIKTIK